MNTYIVSFGLATDLVSEVFVVRAKNCAEVEKLVLKNAGDDYGEGTEIVKIEKLSGIFIG